MLIVSRWQNRLFLFNRLAALHAKHLDEAIMLTFLELNFEKGIHMHPSIDCLEHSKCILAVVSSFVVYVRVVSPVSSLVGSVWVCDRPLLISPALLSSALITSVYQPPVSATRVHFLASGEVCGASPSRL